MGKDELVKMWHHIVHKIHKKEKKILKKWGKVWKKEQELADSWSEYFRGMLPHHPEPEMPHFETPVFEEFVPDFASHVPDFAKPSFWQPPQDMWGPPPPPMFGMPEWKKPDFGFNLF